MGAENPIKAKNAQWEGKTGPKRGSAAHREGTKAAWEAKGRKFAA